MKKHLSVFMLAVILCFTCTGCGTTAFSNASNYFSNARAILNALLPGNSAAKPPQSSENTAAALDTPAGFSIDEGGNYSFQGVENASLYLLYFYDPSDIADGSYIYSSEAIHAESGVTAYQGNCADIVQIAYGRYVVKVQAFPELNDTAHSMSATADAEYTYSGSQETPQIEYLWNTFDNTLSLQLANVSAYTYQAYPDIDITLSNVNDSSDIVTVTLTDVSSSNVLTTDAVKRGETYSITAVARSSSEYVTNPVIEGLLVAEEVTVGELNVMSPQYVCSDGLDGGRLNYPRICIDLNLTEVGSAGIISLKYPIVTTPITPNEGSAYSFDAVFEMERTLSGSLELKNDGTFVLSEFGSGPTPATSIEGFWLDNGDGTATLCYDPSTITIL